MTAALALDAGAADRIANIASRVGSDHEGEAANAARMLTRELDKLGLRLGDVVRRGLGSAPTPMSPPAERMPEHLDLANLCLRSATTWSVSELNFLHRVVTSLRPHPVWLDWLRAMAARAQAANMACAARGGAA